MRHISIPAYISKHDQSKESLKSRADSIWQQIQQLHSDNPEVSVVIPAYNEAENILKTLSSLAATSTSKKVEIIVVNNNSSDETEDLIRIVGATCVTEPKQGIVHARNAGLKQAKGKFILNADADTIYPPAWIDSMVDPLYKDKVALVYGSFSFLPTTNVPRSVFFIYEYISDFSRWINKRFKEEAVNVYGFNSGFRRLEGLQVDSFNHPPGANEDGWLGLKLRTKFNKVLYQVKEPKANAWTTDRRIQIDGGLVVGTLKRFKKYAKVG